MSDTFKQYLEMAEVATKMIKTKNGMGVQYRSTVVVEILDDGGYILDSGGWLTNTTKKRMNKYIDRSFSVFQKNHDWFVRTPKGEFPFRDKMKINADGSVQIGKFIKHDETPEEDQNKETDSDEGENEGEK